jgi:nitrate reductase (NAD(P)H)
MERVKQAGGNLTNGSWGEKLAGQPEEAVEQEPEKDICMTDPKRTRLVGVDEFRKHSGEEQPWFIVNGQVFDGTPFLERHPGGAASIFGAAGQDVTEEFMTIRKINLGPRYKSATSELVYSSKLLILTILQYRQRKRQSNDA